MIPKPSGLNQPFYFAVFFTVLWVSIQKRMGWAIHLWSTWSQLGLLGLKDLSQDGVFTHGSGTLGLSPPLLLLLLYLLFPLFLSLFLFPLASYPLGSLQLDVAWPFHDVVGSWRVTLLTGGWLSKGKMWKKPSQWRPILGTTSGYFSAVLLVKAVPGLICIQGL